MGIQGFFTTLLTCQAFAQTCPTNLKRNAPDSRYESLSGGAEIWDKQTDLVWQRCSLGQSWINNTCTGGIVRYSRRQALEAAKAAGGGWYLPNHRELRSLVEWGCFDPAINITAFPATQPDWYWSSSVHPFQATARVVYFHDGRDQSNYDLYGDFYVRLVRPRQ